MTDILDRLDSFVVALLDESESDTSTSENGTGPQRASITERVQVLKAAVQYLAIRNKLTEDAGGKDEAEEPAIVQFERRLKPRGARRG